MMKINRKDVEHVALLSRLELSETELDKYTGQLDAILEYIDVLNQVDTTGVQPMAHVLELKNVTRPDVVKPSLPQDQALLNAPEPENGFFKVPKIME
jgi:aspartyl-tRNA(Asn)/glutamyl-tRNA(Gln) amidotransferase subunit C